MAKSSIGQLLIESDSAYSLVIAVAKRARDIVKDSEQSGKPLTEKPVSIAIEEFGEHRYKVKD